ncbi:MAG: hypothetical protein V4461_11155 [Pseudomonadota bacterium]
MRVWSRNAKEMAAKILNLDLRMERTEPLIQISILLSGEGLDRNRKNALNGRAYPFN